MRVIKFYGNKKYQTVAIYAAAVIAVNVLLILALNNIGAIMDSIGSFITVLNPVLWGIVISFLTNPIMVKTEKFLKKYLFRVKDPDAEVKSPKLLRGISVVITTMVFLGIVVGLVAVVVPQLITSVIDIFNTSNTIVENVQKWINKVFKNYPYLEKVATNALSNFNTDFGSIMEKIQPMLENVVSGAWSVVTVLKNFMLGFIVSIYMLCSKEKLLAQTKKVVISFTRRRTCEKIMKFANEANRVFAGFLTGKIVDSLIIGLICFIGLTFMAMPYPIMISVLIGVTNIIPFFGPIIGAVPSGLLILLTAPKKVILFLIFVLVLQQFDGNILGPKILGDSTGLPGFWVLLSLLIFSGIFGFAGMVIAVPTFALAYNFFREGVAHRLRKKHLPVDTEYYKQDVAHLYQRPPQKTPLTPEELMKMDIPPIEEVNEVTSELSSDDLI